MDEMGSSTSQTIGLILLIQDLGFIVENERGEIATALQIEFVSFALSCIMEVEWWDVCPRKR